MKTFSRIIKTIVALPISLICAIIISPFILVLNLVELPNCVIQDIWMDE